jgi:hypothetical protein
MNTKRFTILHSNDMHGDFLAEVRGAAEGWGRRAWEPARLSSG